MKKIAILLIAVMVISVGFLSGCTEVEKDLGEALEGEVVSVSVYAYADVSNPSNYSLEGVQVKFEFIKTGGKDRTYSEDIWDGRALCPYVGYNLHEGESIYASATILDFVGDAATLTFSDAKENGQEVGNDAWTYTWEPDFKLVIH